MRPSEIQPIRYFCNKCGKEIKSKIDYNYRKNAPLNHFAHECNDCLSKTTEIILSQSEIEIIKNWTKNARRGWNWQEHNGDFIFNKIINIEDGKVYLTDLEILTVFSWSTYQKRHKSEEKEVIHKLRSIINESPEMVKRKGIRQIRFFCKKCGKEIDDLDYKVNGNISMKYFLEVCYCADCFDEKKIKKFRKLKDEEFSKFYSELLKIKSKLKESDFLETEKSLQDIINRVINMGTLFSDSQFEKLEDLMNVFSRRISIFQSLLGEKFKTEIMRKRKEERKLEKEK